MQTEQDSENFMTRHLTTYDHVASEKSNKLL
jgi:hypothetical protein